MVCVVEGDLCPVRRVIDRGDIDAQFYVAWVTIGVDRNRFPCADGTTRLGAVLLIRTLGIHDYRAVRIATKASRGSDRGLCERKTLADDDIRRIRHGAQSLR